VSASKRATRGLRIIEGRLDSGWFLAGIAFTITQELRCPQAGMEIPREGSLKN
jgi:hypothetical protein